MCAIGNSYKYRSFCPSRRNKLIAGKMVKNCVAAGCKSTCPDIVSFLNSRAMTTVESSGFGKCGELTIIGTDRLSIAFCAKGILVKIASSLRQLWYQLWEYSGGKSLIWTLFPLFLSIQNRRVHQTIAMHRSYNIYDQA